ncbi:Ku protein [Falsochrobactrum shanghaiense]|uniref:Non-homologous end joining protein Ku n=1 Tax=Falsochrobactrum shanghaiense TaxID=2201899 RepID=A0A316J714_9HYPH|nr:Ku protein [Falsochrobactrum shanghaiense]PWL16559.1 Ku protein [Falsochrobactrum shanghaiense]
MPHAFWKGYLKLSLVTCAVELMPATSESDKIRFHMLNKTTGNRIVSRYVDSQTHKMVRDEDQVKGFEKAEGDYVVLEDEELESVALESTRTIDVDKFIPSDSIGWIWYDKPHYLTPSDKVGQEAFAVIREAMEKSKVFGLARLVMYRRERAVLLEPRGKGIILWTLRFGDEVRNPDDYFAQIENSEPEKKLVTMVRKLIRERTEGWDPDVLQDPVQKNLKSMIAARKKKRKPAARPKTEAIAPSAGNVVNIMDALRKSLAGEKKPS